jgi:GTPase SAR1 family protein
MAERRQESSMAPPIELLDRALALSAACGRQDLHRRLTAARDRARNPGVRVLVAGQPRTGKSTLVNALVGAPVCPAGDDAATAVPTVVREGSAPEAVLVFSCGAGETGEDRVPVPVEGLPGRVLESARHEGTPRLLRAEVRLPRRLLSRGLEVVDTAGVGGIGPAGALRTLELLPGADAVVIVSDASQEFTAPELAFVRQAAALCPTVICVLTKIDAHAHWRTILDLDRAHLRDAGLEAPLFAVSSTLELLAVARQDRELHEESGFADLLAHLRTEVGDSAEALALRSTVHDLTSVTEQLTMALRTELTALQDPAGTERLMAELEDARTRADDLRRRSSRWQQMLSDGVADLMADIDYDLRDRSRAVIRDAEEAIDAGDPGPMWDDFTDWVDERVAEAVAESYVWATQRSEWLAARVVEQFAREGGTHLPELVIGDPEAVLGELVALSEIDRGDMAVRERLLIGVRGSYSGVLMTGLLTSLTGMALLNPVSLAAGALMGRKVYKDDVTNRRLRRQSEAKSAVRRHMDEVVFQVGKHLKDRLRLVQRTLRELITDTVDEMTRTLAEATKAAQRSATAAAAERDARIRTLRAQLEQVERLAREVPRPAGDPVPVA